MIGSVKALLNMHKRMVVYPQHIFNVFPKKHFEIDENKQKQFQIITKSN